MNKKLTLPEIKGIELNILKAFHAYCIENGLQYSLCGGSLLGAIRHKGFIPWDDDIDVFMPRPDYEKLRSLCGGKCLKKRYYLLDWKIAEEKRGKPFMHYPFLKIIDLNTEVDAKDISRKYYSGVWIDVFPVDGLPESASKTKEIYKKTWFWRQLFSLHYCKKIIAKGVLQKIVKMPFLPIARLINGLKICKKLDDLSQTYDYESAEFVGGVIHGYGPQEKIRKTDMEPMDIEFEGCTFMGIKGYDVYLRNLYHDYMQLPPEDKRIRHDFDAWLREDELR